MPEIERRTPQQLADMLAEALEATAGQLARSRPQQPVTAAAPEVVDAVLLLTHLARRADDWPNLCYRAMCGTAEREEWALLANVLRSTAEACQRLVGDQFIIQTEEP
jgi:hypothetical protein